MYIYSETISISHKRILDMPIPIIKTKKGNIYDVHLIII